jgi:chromosome segregation ATPase
MDTYAPLAPLSESVLTDAEQKAIRDHARIRQLEVELTAEKATSDRLRTQRDQARQAGAVLIGQRDDLQRQLDESQALTRAQALALEKFTDAAHAAR